MTAISFLDLCRVQIDGSPRISLDNARDLALLAEGLGYRRFWVAEHHNMDGVASAATSVVIGHIAAGTRSIRVGAGGIMLPNHAPMIIAEQFGTLAHLYPGRIDLGLGRAPGSDQMTMRALRRTLEAAHDFPGDVQELQAFFAPLTENQRLQAVPATDTGVPIWILGSSTYGAQLAAHLGLPYAFASHFAPQQLLAAISLYKANFQPSAALEAPYIVAGINIIAADTDAEAQRLRTSQLMSFVDLHRGASIKTKPPIDEIDTYWNPLEKQQVLGMMDRSLIGSLDTVRKGLAGFLAETGVDELMIVSEVYDHGARRKSMTLIAEAMRGLGESDPGTT